MAPAYNPSTREAEAQTGCAGPAGLHGECMPELHSETVPQNASK